MVTTSSHRQGLHCLTHTHSSLALGWAIALYTLHAMCTRVAIAELGKDKWCASKNCVSSKMDIYRNCRN